LPQFAELGGKLSELAGEAIAERFDLLLRLCQRLPLRGVVLLQHFRRFPQSASGLVQSAERSSQASVALLERPDRGVARHAYAKRGKDMLIQKMCEPRVS
jgi:hypothetical protein